MNIFFLHPDPEIAAKILCNKHVVKMILESAQMICTVLRRYGITDEQFPNMYKKAHPKHPSTLWAGEKRGNLLWLYHHAIAMSKEYTYRYGKVHTTYTKILSKALPFIKAINIPEGYSRPREAMPDLHKTDNPVESYISYYLIDKSRMLEWYRKDGKQKIHLDVYEMLFEEILPWDTWFKLFY